MREGAFVHLHCCVCDKAGPAPLRASTSLRLRFLALAAPGIQLALTTIDPATKRPPPFSFTADKATLDRRTGQMAGVIPLLRGELTALMLSVLPAPDSTGKGLGKLSIATLMDGKPLRLSKELLQASLMGNAFDGQYQGEHEGHASGLQVKNHICN